MGKLRPREAVLSKDPEWIKRILEICSQMSDSGQQGTESPLWHHPGEFSFWVHSPITPFPSEPPGRRGPTPGRPYLQAAGLAISQFGDNVLTVPAQNALLGLLTDRLLRRRDDLEHQLWFVQVVQVVADLTGAVPATAFGSSLVPAALLLRRRTCWRSSPRALVCDRRHQSGAAGTVRWGREDSGQDGRAQGSHY